MSKNMKFLRKGALLLAVLAMVLGQCFGMLGGVAAQAATLDTVAQSRIAALEWVSVPEQVLAGQKAEAVLAVTLKKGYAYEDAEITISRDKTGINVFRFVNNGTMAAVTDLAFGAITADATQEQVTVEVPVTWTVPDRANNYSFIAAIGTATGAYNTFSKTALQTNPYKTIKVVTDATAPEEFDSTVLAFAYDTTTGQPLTTTPTYKFGDELNNFKVARYDADGKFVDYVATRYSVTNLTTGKTVTTYVMNRKEVPTNGYFVEGINTLRFIYGGVGYDLDVDIELADTTTDLTGLAWKAGSAYGAITSPYTDGDSVPVQLTAAVAAVDVEDVNFTKKPAADDTYGTVIFYDGDTVLAEVPVGEAKDVVPSFDGYEAVEKTSANNEAIYAFMATKGEHEFSAAFVPAGKNAAWVAGSASPADEAIKLVVAPEYEYNFATLTFENALLKFDTTDVTLSFDAPVSAGTATVTFTDTAKKTVTVTFALNDIDTSYTKQVNFSTTGKWTASLKVNFGKETELQTSGKAPTTGDLAPTKVTANRTTSVTYLYPEDQGRFITVCENASETVLTASATSGEVGDKIDLTATVTSGSDKVTKGTVQFVKLYVDDDGETKAENLGKPVAVTDAKAEYTLTLDSSIVGVYAIYVPDEDDTKFTYAGSESDTIDLTVVNQAGALEIVAPEEPAAATDEAVKFTVKVLNADGKQDLTFAGRKSVTWTVGEVEATKIYSFSAGQATVTVNAKLLDAGTHTVTFTVKDAEYGTLTGTAALTVSEPVLTATSLSIDDDALEATAAMGDVIADTNITVTVKDAYGFGTYTAATGSVELYLGDVLVATADVTNGVAAFANVKALTGGEDLVLTAKYLGDKAYAASQVTGDKKIDVTKRTTAMTVAVDGNELTITLNVPTGYTPSGKLAITAGETTLATIDAVKAENVVTLANPALAGEQDVTVAFTGDSGMTDATKTVKVTFEAVSGWYENPKGTWYYFEEGEMLANEWVQDGFWYYLGADGVMVKGWKQLEWNGVTDWYYFKTYAPNSGSMMTGWQFLGGKWYYMASSGKMLTGWQQLGGKWYYLDPVNGDMETGWQQLGGKWYYMDPTNGDMKTGWQKVGNTWYYMNASGAMVTGWQRLSWNGVTNWYYFQSSGAMATSGTIDGWNIASSGIATPAN